MPFISHLKAHRLAKNWTQVQLAKASGVTRVTIGYIENRRIEPSAETMFRLAAALDVTVHDLFERMDERPPPIPKRSQKAARILAREG